MTDTNQTEANGREIFVPLNKLKKSPRNARKVPHGEAAIEALAASIHHKGMIQNLVVEPETEDGAPTGSYFVTAGEGRRLAQLLRAKRKQIKRSEPIRCYLVVNTSRRTYHLELRSAPASWMASVSWSYPGDRLLALQRGNAAASAAAPLAGGVALERLNFRYRISGDDPSWRPLRAFDDGEKVYVQFPAGIAQGELPPLFVIGAAGDAQLVNYRVRPPYYVVDQLFAAAELRLGGRDARTVRIEREDGRRRSRR